MSIGQSPNHEFAHVRFFEEHVHKLAVQVPLLGVVRFGEFACRTLRESDVEFGDVQSHAEICKCFGECAHVLRSCFVCNFDVGLRAYAGDRNVVCFPALDLFHDKACLGSFAEAPFDGIIVVAELCIRVGFVRPDKCGIQKFCADAFVPNGVCGTPVGIVIVIDGFVHHVPFGDLTFPVADNFGDVVLENGEQLFFLALIVVHPVCNLAVPGESVSTNAESVCLCVFDHLVALFEVEIVFFGLCGVKLHFVFGDDHVELSLVNFFEFRFNCVVEPFAIQDGADKAATFLGELTNGFVSGLCVHEACAKKCCTEYKF